MRHLLCIASVTDKRLGDFTAGRIYNLVPVKADTLRGRHPRAFIGVTVTTPNKLPPRLFRIAREAREMNRADLPALVRA